MTEIGKVSTKIQKIEWTVDDFSSYTDECAKYRLPDFFAGDSKWYIEIYPNGDAQDVKEYISVFLYKREEGTPMTVEYGIGIKTSKNTVQFEHTSCNTFNKDKLGWGWNTFLKRSELLQRKSELLPLDVLTITCFVKVKSAEANLESSEYEIKVILKAMSS